MPVQTNRLSEYLRARRELVTPESVGLPQYGVRRVPGLRREEVSLLAGISANYYLRLEQGRDRNPSAQVLDALARVFQLDETATTYLHELAAPTPRRRARKPRPTSVPPDLTELLGGIGLPAFVADRYLQVLAANPLVTALSPAIRKGQNRLRSIFLDPAEQALHLDWERTAPLFVEAFRRHLGNLTDDPRAIELVGELSLASPQFRRVWARQDVKVIRGERVRMDHPQVGEITLGMSKMNAQDHLLVVAYHAEPGSRDAERLGLLSSLAATVTAGNPYALHPARS